jgi:predicted site-specific integrase-resolvase
MYKAVLGLHFQKAKDSSLFTKLRAHCKSFSKLVFSYEFSDDTHMLIGYARVSTSDQTLDLQKDALEKATGLGAQKAVS